MFPSGGAVYRRFYETGHEWRASYPRIQKDRIGSLNFKLRHYPIFKVKPDGSEIVLYSFNGVPDGSSPYGSLIADDHGNLYGTTVYGGQSGGCACGTVFKFAPDGTLTTLYTFAGGSDAGYPVAGLISDGSGRLYGTTTGGVGTGCGGGGCGAIFETSFSGGEKVLYGFTGGNDGAIPYAGLLLGQDGKLYGTAIQGGAHASGTIFALKK